MRIAEVHEETGGITVSTRDLDFKAAEKDVLNGFLIRKDVQEGQESFTACHGRAASLRADRRPPCMYTRPTRSPMPLPQESFGKGADTVAQESAKRRARERQLISWS